MNTTRRNLLQLFGGSAVGAVFTPAPWRLITDGALWSENWPGIPRPARGEFRAKFTNCSLCDAGCAVRARCVGEQPIALAGVGGGLCPFGLTAHHLPYHPARLRAGPITEAAAAVRSALAKCGPAEHVAVLDLRPGRTVSWTFRRIMATIRNGVYIAPTASPVAVDLSSARTVLSLGAPLLDGWGTPAGVFSARDHFRLIQAESIETRTASLADQWLPIHAGSEGALALAVAGALNPEEAAGLTGLTLLEVETLVADITSNGPSLIVDREMSPAAVQANVRLGNWGRTIGPRHEAPIPESWKKAAPVSDLLSLPDRSVRVLFIDESAAGGHLPWQTIEKKLVADGPLVVAFAWSSSGYARHAHFTLPTAFYPEVLDDIPTAIDSTAASYRLSSPLVPGLPGMANPAEFVAGVAGFSAGDPLRERADAIHKAGRGTLISYADAKTAAVKEVKAEDLWKTLTTGGRWEDSKPLANTHDLAPLPTPLPPVPARAREATSYAVLVEGHTMPLVSPLMSKVYQESRLRLAPNCIALHPGDAAACGVADGARAVLETPAGRWQVEVMTDGGVRPGVILAAQPEMAATSAKVMSI